LTLLSSRVSPDAHTPYLPNQALISSNHCCAARSRWITRQRKYNPLILKVPETDRTSLHSCRALFENYDEDFKSLLAALKQKLDSGEIRDLSGGEQISESVNNG
jgi:hypothetical protein